MADGAGPSAAAGTGAVEEAVLQEAERKFERGIQCIRTNDLEQAVQLFAEVLQVRTQHYGELAPECASAYYRYGAALLYQAQDSGDVFGAGVAEAAEEEGGAAEPEVAEDKENGKGKAPAAAPAGDAAAGEEEEEEEGSEEAAAENDLQLAWENLDTAKAIWAKDAAAHAQQLADVHSLLGDVAMESDDFPTALAELDASLAHLAKFVQEDDRRIAEVQYKRCCALQFSGDVEQALPAVQAAVDCLAKRRAVLAAKLAAPGEGDDVEKLTAESEDVAAVEADLGEKVAELKELIAQNLSDKNMLKGLFAQAMGGPAGAAAPAPPSEQQAQAGGEGGFGAGSAPAGGAAPGVKNLGVVGRGTKRINLQPVQTNVMPAAPAAAGGCAPSGEPAAKKKRSLEDLMGGGEAGETTIGFGGGAPAAAPAPAAPAPALAPAVPAFLQAASVQAVYGEAGKSAQPE